MQAALSAEGGFGGEGEKAASPSVAEGGGVPPDGEVPQRPILRLRNRRRRRQRPPGTPAISGSETQSADAAPAEGISGEGAADAAQSEAPPGERSPRPRRRRRRRPGTAPANGEPGAVSPSGEVRPDGDAAPDRRPRNRRPREGVPREVAAPGEARRQPPPRDRTAAPGSGDRGPRGPGARRDHDPRRRDGRRDGRGRDEGARRPERKLYNFDSVIDRGFEDVEEEVGTRRVPWTIIKRTIADQVSRKAVSTAYVVQRDGLETEFPSLGGARSAVNKTIVHPEKLTLSKAEHVAAKK